MSLNQDFEHRCFPSVLANTPPPPFDGPDRRAPFSTEARTFLKIWRKKTQVHQPIPPHLHLLRNLISGSDPFKGFSPITSPNKLNHGHAPWQARSLAVSTLWWALSQSSSTRLGLPEFSISPDFSRVLQDRVTRSALTLALDGSPKEDYQGSAEQSLSGSVPDVSHEQIEEYFPLKVPSASDRVMTKGSRYCILGDVPHLVGSLQMLYALQDSSTMKASIST